MGKKKTVQNIPSKIPAMDPVLIKAFSRGRESGYKEGREEGKVEGMAEVMTFFHIWTENIDSYIKGIGPMKKADIQNYFAERMKESIERNKEMK